MVMDMTNKYTKQYSTVVNPDIYDLGSVNKIKNVTKYTDNGYLGKNAFILDGSLGNADDDFQIGMWSSFKSGNDCSFASASTPTLTITVTSDLRAYKIYGIGFKFYEDYPQMMRIKFEGDSLIDERIITYYPDRLDYLARAELTNFKKATITFLKTRKPNQDIKVSYITFGKYCEWEKDDVTKGTLNEDVDITNATLPMNTASISILDKQNDFDVLTKGIWQYIDKNQIATLSEFVDGREIALGKFYVDTWNTSDNVTTFEMRDAIGIMDEVEMPSHYYSNRTATNVFSIILGKANIDFEISSYYDTINVSGVIPTMSCREALHRVAFSLGAVVDTSRSSKVRIYPPDKNVDSYVMVNRKFSGETTSELDEYVSGVAINVKEYTNDNANALIKTISVVSGQKYRIKLDKMYTSLYGTYANSGSMPPVNFDTCDYVEFTATLTRDLNLYGKELSVSEYTLQKNVENATEENVKTFGDVTIFNSDQLQNVLTQLLKWYSLRQKVTMSYLLDSEKVGEWIGIQSGTNTDRYATTCINSQSVDLTGGFIANAECRGYSDEVSTYYEMGNGELAMPGVEVI